MCAVSSVIETNVNIDYPSIRDRHAVSDFNTFGGVDPASRPRTARRRATKSAPRAPLDAFVNTTNNNDPSRSGGIGQYYLSS